MFDGFRYSDEQIPGVLYASVNPEYMTSTDGIKYLKLTDSNLYLLNVVVFGCRFFILVFLKAMTGQIFNGFSSGFQQVMSQHQERRVNFDMGYAKHLYKCVFLQRSRTLDSFTVISV